MPKLSQEMRQKLGDAIFSLSLANLIFIRTWSEVQRGFSISAYFRKLPNGTSLAVMLNVTVLAIVLWFGIQLKRRYPSRWLQWGSRLIYAVAAMEVLISLHAWMSSSPLPISHWVKNPLFWLLLGAIAWWHKPCLRAARAVVLIMSPFVLVTFAQALSHLDTGREPPQRSAVPLPSATTAAKQPRLVWLIYDEMDQRIAFTERPESLRLPEFDGLRGQSTYFENAFPPSNMTELSMPALITGHWVVTAEPTGRDCLMLTLHDRPQPIKFSEVPSVFSQARDLGLTTGIVGWYHPYSRLFPFVNRSFWNSTPYYDILGDACLSEVMVYPYYSAFSSGEVKYRHAYISVYETTQSWSRELVADGRIRFVFCHCPLPHLPGIYDRFSSRIGAPAKGTGEGYLGNLALADKGFGELRRSMEDAALWKDTTVVLTADHWLRETNAYDGKLDHRVPLLIKMAGQTQNASYSKPLNTLLLPKLVLAVLKREVNTATELVQWLDAHRTSKEFPVDAYQASRKPN
jgi:hypothetical protein